MILTYKVRFTENTVTFDAEDSLETMNDLIGEAVGNPVSIAEEKQVDDHTIAFYLDADVPGFGGIIYLDLVSADGKAAS